MKEEGKRGPSDLEYGEEETRLDRWGRRMEIGGKDERGRRRRKMSILLVREWYGLDEGQDEYANAFSNVSNEYTKMKVALSAPVSKLTAASTSYLSSCFFYSNLLLLPSSC